MILQQLIDLFYPNICVVCKSNLLTTVNLICIDCSSNISFTKFTNQENNILEQKFYGRCSIEEATALVYYEKNNITQQLIQELKYNNKEGLGFLFGNWLGHEIIESNRFNNIDMIISVPLHKNKLKKRGYNQLTAFGNQLASILEIPHDEVSLIKISNNKSQTKYNRFMRWSNSKEHFKLIDYKKLEGKHILLIDDVITTGATIENCVKELQKTQNIKISIASISFTK